MATLRWNSHPTADRQVTLFASGLPVTSWRTFATIVRKSFAARAQLRRSSGLVSFTLIAEFRTRTLWTVSAWESESDMAAFVGAEPHVSVMRGFRGRLGTPRFRQWVASSGEIPHDRDAIVSALEHAAMPGTVWQR